MSDKGKKKGFYLFCAIVVIAVAMCVYGYLSLDQEQPEVQAYSEPMGKVEVGEVPPSTEILKRRMKMPEITQSEITQPEITQMDDTLFQESLSEGAIPTQDVGERGSLEGAIRTNNPLVYPETKYERLENSPLLRFTDEMIWKNGSDNEFKVKRDAIQDQAKTIQESSIALNVAPRVEMGKIKGYRLVEIPPDTLFAKMGMVSGDIVLTINGRMPDMEPMALMFVNMVAGKQGATTIEVEHRGEKRTIRLQAAD